MKYPGPRLDHFGVRVPRVAPKYAARANRPWRATAWRPGTRAHRASAGLFPDPTAMPLARPVHTLLASGATRCSRFSSAFAVLRDVRPKFKTAWRFCFSPHEPQISKLTPPETRQAQGEFRGKCEKCGLDPCRSAASVVPPWFLGFFAYSTANFRQAAMLRVSTSRGSALML